MQQEAADCAFKVSAKRRCSNGMQWAVLAKGVFPSKARIIEYFVQTTWMLWSMMNFANYPGDG
jgi:hypothetical protein